MLKGTCHCGKVGWALDREPKSVTACNCTICRRYGTLWAYGYDGHDIQTTGHTSIYRRRDGGDILFHFCAICGCVTHFIACSEDENGRKRTAVNVRMSDPSPINSLPIRHFDGHDSFKELPRDGRMVKDIWF
ncbi:GFA family protein [Parasphingorhabdus cellanae]|uniref:GFA family protein n=1 Tax=Parasphingorhabdus cellanae TaxID=2806553 RepID=UPI00404693D1